MRVRVEPSGLVAVVAIPGVSFQSRADGEHQPASVEDAVAIIVFKFVVLSGAGTLALVGVVEAANGALVSEFSFFAAEAFTGKADALPVTSISDLPVFAPRAFFASSVSGEPRVASHVPGVGHPATNPA
jgi:hypothetical protein